MSRVYYLDTSAVLKRYRSEAGTEVVDVLYESFSEHRPAEHKRRNISGTSCDPRPLAT